MIIILKIYWLHHSPYVYLKNTQIFNSIRKSLVVNCKYGFKCFLISDNCSWCLELCCFQVAFIVVVPLPFLPPSLLRVPLSCVLFPCVSCLRVVNHLETCRLSQKNPHVDLQPVFESWKVTDAAFPFPLILDNVIVLCIRKDEQ